MAIKMDNGQRADKLQIICESVWVSVCECECVFVRGDDSANFKGASKTRKTTARTTTWPAKCPRFRFCCGCVCELGLYAIAICGPIERPFQVDTAVDKN